MKIPGLKKHAQEKVDAALKRARSAGAKFAAGGKGTAYSGGTGAACFYAVKMLHEKDASGKPRFEFVEKQPYAVPVALAIAGHFVKRKQHDVGAAMVGVAGFTAAAAYDQAKANEKTAAAMADVSPAGTSTGYGAGELVAGAVVPMFPAHGMHPSYGQSAYGVQEAGAIVEPASVKSFLALSDT